MLFRASIPATSFLKMYCTSLLCELICFSLLFSEFACFLSLWFSFIHNFMWNLIASNFAAHLCMIEKTAKSATVILSRVMIRIIPTIESDLFLIFSHLNATEIFDSIHIESRAENTIAFEILTSNLSLGLEPGTKADKTVLKLTKRDGNPFLRAEFTMPDGEVSLVHDMPIRVMGESEARRHEILQLQVPPVCMTIPQPRMLCSVLDRMCSLGAKNAAIRVTMDMGREQNDLGDVQYEEETSTYTGTLSLSCEYDLVNICTRFAGLQRDKSSDNQAIRLEELVRSGTNETPMTPLIDASLRGQGSCLVPGRPLSRWLKGVANSPLPTYTTMGVVPGKHLLTHTVLENYESSGSVTIVFAVAQES